MITLSIILATTGNNSWFHFVICVSQRNPAICQKSPGIMVDCFDCDDCNINFNGMLYQCQKKGTNEFHIPGTVYISTIIFAGLHVCSIPKR